MKVTAAANSTTMDGISSWCVGDELRMSTNRQGATHLVVCDQGYAPLPPSDRIGHEVSSRRRFVRGPVPLSILWVDELVRR